MRLKTLKPRVQTLKSNVRIAPVSHNPNATPRTRGRKWMERRAAWLSAHPLCVECEAEGRVTAAQEVDHITPLWRGGADDESNYQSLCIDHHKAKTAEEAQLRISRNVTADFAGW